MKDLTVRQRRVLEFIKKAVESKGYPPSVREICDGVGLKSTSTVHGHLRRLEDKGYIRRDPTKPRAIELTGDSVVKRDTVAVPVVGKVTAGQPILAVENIEDYFPLPSSFLGGDGEVFMLKVRGDSMIDAGILDDDYVIVRRQSTADNGDIVVALIDQEEATVKRIYKEQDRVRLQPENPAMSPIYRQDVDVLGKVIGVIRKI